MLTIRHGAWLIAAAMMALPAAQAKVFKWSSASDISTLDIHSQNIAFTNGVHAAIFDALVSYNSRTFKPEPQLATGWREISPVQIRFNLRSGVKFSDGSPLGADDVVFSLMRAMSKTSNHTVYTQSMDRVVKVNDLTIDIHLKNPNPVLLNQLTELRIMSRAWAERNRSVEPKDIRSKDENHAHRNALGSGPFMVKEWQPDQKLVLVRNPNYWGHMDSNVTEVIYLPIKAETTRTAALLSGEIDLLLDPSPQDLGRLRQTAALKVLDGTENRTIFLGMDQFRDELPGSDIKGKNPLKDIRVRKALYHAIDINSLQRTTLRGMGHPTGALVTPIVNGWSESAHKRLSYDIDSARKLLTEAGYGHGFEVDFACPNNRYVNDEEVCQSITAMWAKVGVKAKLRTLPSATYFPMLQRFEASIYLMGWGVPTLDALYALQSLTRTMGIQGDGSYNLGRYSNPRMDYIVDRAKSETDLLVRNRLLAEGLVLQNDTVAHIPLYNQSIPWAMKRHIDVVHRTDNRIDWRLIRVN